MDISKIKKYFVDFYNDFKHDEQKRNRVLILFLIFIGACSVVLGFSNTKQNIKKPFIDENADAVSSVYDTYNKLKAQGKIVDDTTGANTTNTTNTITTNSTNNTNTSNTSVPYPGFPSKTVDTDGDGLSDYDEVNVFHTSPFLADSNSDGINDYDSIKRGIDPNAINANSNTITNTPTTNTTTNNNSATTIANTIDPTKIDVAQARIELAKIIPESLKPMLANMTDDQIKSLMSQLYSGTVTPNNTSTNVVSTNNATTNTNTTNNTNINTITDYKSVLKSKLPQFTVAQISTIKAMNEIDIKKLLLDSNVADESLLSQFKTGELKSTVLGE